MIQATAPSPIFAGFSGLRPLLGEFNDLKRVRAAGRSGSLAARGFARSWAALIAGEPPARVARSEVAAAFASARLGAIDPAILSRAGLAPGDVREVIVAAIEDAAAGIDSVAVDDVRGAVAGLAEYYARFDEPTSLPSWVGLLAEQPRAGATRPGLPRLILEPAESHAEHCYVTAIYAALLAPRFAADPSVPFLAGLAHHLHNAFLPDSGYSGEGLLGPHLAGIVERFTEEAVAELPTPLAGAVADARRILPHAATPEACAFHAADVLDRVLQMGQYARAAAFELRQALDDLDLVHPGPLQAFQLDVLVGAGLWP